MGRLDFASGKRICEVRETWAAAENYDIRSGTNSAFNCKGGESHSLGHIETKAKTNLMNYLSD